MQPLKNRKYPGSYLARQRSRARALHARVYAAADGRVLLVRGKPDPKQMLRYLSHLDEGKTHLITPADLGIPRSSVDELTDAQLTSASHALTKWNLLLERRLHKRRRTDRYRAELREIAELQHRLHQLYQWKRTAAEHALASQSPWLLDRQQETQLASLVACEWASDASLTRLTWMARLVFWTAGPHATSRFCHATQPLLQESIEEGSRRVLRATLAKLHVWHKRASHERARSIQCEIEQWMDQLPNRIVARAGLSAKLKGQPLRERLEQQIARCKQALRECSDGGRHRIATGIATLVVTDNAIAPVPQRLMLHWIAKNDNAAMVRSIEELLEECKQPGYNRLLQAIDTMAEPPVNDMQFVREQLCMSQRIQDIQWIISCDLQHTLARMRLRVSSARHLVDQLQRFGIEVAGYYLNRMLEESATLEGFDVLRGFVDWIASLPSSLHTPRLRKLLWSTLLEMLLPGLSFDEVQNSLRQWNRLVSVPRGPESCNVMSWTELICDIQLSLGQSASLPGKVRRLLDARSRRLQEQSHLLALETQGAATPSQIARRRHLASESTSTNKESSKALRTAQDSFVHVALDAFRVAVRQGTQSALGEPLGRFLTNASMRRVMQFADWRSSMTSHAQQLLQQLLDAHHRHGSQYKRRLALNRQWLKQARAYGIDIDAWLTGGASVVNTAGRVIRIEVTTNPMDVFLMGTYFGNCLSLGRENQLSVLANAADANKQVVFVRDKQGRVQARQLIAISSQFELVGYCCYVNEACDNQETRDAIVAAVARFCGNLARRCNIPLADEGEPVALGAHFWYDDGTYQWHKASTPVAEPSQPRPVSMKAISASQTVLVETPLATGVEYVGWRD